MKSSVLTLRKPIPLARAIRWVPAGLFTPPRTLDDLALFITQSALREVLRHLRSDPEQELLGFLLGELYECPETSARYVVVNSAVRTGHAIAESDRILIPEEEWLGVQLEVRRRRTQLVGWYHSAPFVGPHPARADLDTHRALFTEPWQCGLVIATSGEAPAGAFFRSLMGERTGGGVLIPFYELPDEDEPIPADGRKRTLIDWVNYETRGTVERDESEARPFVPSRPSKPNGAPVILSVPSAPAGVDEDEDEDEPGPGPVPEPRKPELRTPPQRAPERPEPEHRQPDPRHATSGERGGAARQPDRASPRTPRDDSATVLPLTPNRPGRTTPSGASTAPPEPAGTEGVGARSAIPSSEPQRPRATTPPPQAQRPGPATPPPESQRRGPTAPPPEEPPHPRPTTPARGGSGLVMLPSAAELQELLAEPAPDERRGGGGRGFFRYFAALLVVAAVAYIYLWNSGRVQLPGFLSGIPVLDNASTPTPPLGTGDRENASAGPAGAGGSAPGEPSPISDSAGAVLSSADSPSVPSPSSTAGSAGVGTGAGVPSTGDATASTTSSAPSAQHFIALADSLELSIRNFQDRNDDFAVHRITCDGLAVGYRAADDAFIALASAHRAALESLDSTAEARYRRLVDRMGRVNEEFGASGCPRP